jgi:hypothetical protein
MERLRNRFIGTSETGSGRKIGVQKGWYGRKLYHRRVN